MSKQNPHIASAQVPALRLKRALAFVLQTIDRRVAIPILSMARIGFNADEGTAKVIGTDLDIELEALIDVDSVQGGDFTLIVPPRPIADFLRACADDDMVTLSVNADRLIDISAGGCNLYLREMCSQDDWPNFGPMLDRTPQKRAEIDGETMRRALAAVVPCISPEETRYYLQGVYVHSKGGGMMLCATDGHRLALYTTDVPYPLPDAILPARAAKILLRALGKGNGAPITVQATDGGIGAAFLRFDGDGWTIRAKAIDGTYPDYTRVMPAPDREVKITATINSAALRRLPTLNRCGAQIVKIEPDAGRMTTSQDGVTASAPVTGSGEPFGMNIKYLRAITYVAGTVKFTSQAARGEPFSVLTDDPALRYVIMSMWTY